MTYFPLPEKNQTVDITAPHIRLSLLEERVEELRAMVEFLMNEPYDMIPACRAGEMLETPEGYDNAVDRL